MASTWMSDLLGNLIVLREKNLVLCGKVTLSVIQVTGNTKMQKPGVRSDEIC